MVKKKLKHVIFQKSKPLRSRIVGQKCFKKRNLRMGLPGTQNLSQLYAIILMLSRASQVPYNAKIEKFYKLR